MNNTCILGIDTSAYTTSLALMTVCGTLLVERRTILSVPAGQRGLRQADALYQHVKNLPLLYESVFRQQPGIGVAAVCVSIAPRPQDGSYMPVFLAGASAAHCTAAALNVPVWEASHQEGHIWAALWSSTPADAAVLADTHRFLAVHLSGGTTEALVVESDETNDAQRLRIDLVGGTQDISAGQFVDRVGVALGLPFPAGPHLENLAGQTTAGVLTLPLGVKNGHLSFSGPESAAQRAIAAGAPPEEIARATYLCIAETLARWLNHLLHEHRINTVLLSGGVISSLLLRRYLTVHQRLKGVRLVFAAPRYSSDNAVGLAAWGAARISDVPLLALPQRGVYADPTEG